MSTNLISFNFSEVIHLLVLTVFNEIFRSFLVCKILSSSNKNNIFPSVGMFFFFIIALV